MAFCADDKLDLKMAAAERLWLEIYDVMELNIEDVRTVLESSHDDDEYDDVEEDILRVLREGAHDAVRIFLLMKDQL